MGYDGGFAKIRMKMRNQNDLNKYVNLRNKIYNCIGKDNFYKFESGVNLPMLNNDWVQVRILRETLASMNKRVYNAYDTNGFTLITQEELGQYISDLYGFLSSEDVKLFEEDIKLLEELYDTFDWENDTLVFSYSC